MSNHLGLHVSEKDIVGAYENGHEIADHTYSHMSSRGVVTSASATQDANLMWATRLYSNNSIDLALEKIKQAQLVPQWLHLFTHDVRNAPSKFGCTPEDLQTIIDAVKDSGLRVMTVDEAYRAITETP